MHTDHTGKFPAWSIRAHQCIMIIYVYDTKIISCRPLLRKQAKELKSAYDDLCACLRARCYKPIFHCIENEISNKIQDLLEQKIEETVEIVLPNWYRRDAE